MRQPWVKATFCPLAMTSGLPQSTDVRSAGRHVSKVPKTDMPKSVANGFPTDIAVNGIVDPPNLNIPSNRLE